MVCVLLLWFIINTSVKLFNILLEKQILLAMNTIYSNDIQHSQLRQIYSIALHSMWYLVYRCMQITRKSQFWRKYFQKIILMLGWWSSTFIVDINLFICKIDLSKKSKAWLHEKYSVLSLVLTVSFLCKYTVL